MNSLSVILLRSFSTCSLLASKKVKHGMTPFARLIVEPEFVETLPAPKYNRVTTFENVIFPPGGASQLPKMPEEPIYDPELGEAKHKQTRRGAEGRGEELIHTELLHRQFGLRIVTGGMLKPKDYDLLQTRINRCLKPNQFAIWRVDAPWLPRTKKAKGTKLGGGKGSIHHYVTPVRAGRILLEVGGYITEMEARSFLSYLPAFLPVKTEFISQQLIDERRALEREIRSANTNPFDWDTVLKYNMQSCYSWLSPYDVIWKCKYK